MTFFKKNKNRMIVTGVAIILIIIIGMTGTERMKLTKAEKIAGNIFAPIEKFFFDIGKKVSEFFSTISSVGKLKKENEQLKKKIAILENENRKYEDIIGKTDYLKAEAQLLKDSNFELIPAQVIGKDPGNWFDKFMIDKGSKDGVKKGDTVIQGVETGKNVVQEGIVGRVVDVGDNWAKIISIVDESNNTSFKVIRNQDGGMLSESIDGELSGYLFDNKADVIKGDKLFTSGLGGSYVKDLYIGDIKEVIKKDDDLMKRVIILPAVNFKKLYKVYIISN